MQIGLLETGNSHDECMFSQALFLKQAGAEVVIVATQTILERTHVWRKNLNIQGALIPNGEGLAQALVVRRWLNKWNFDRIIINTAHGKSVRNLLIICNFWRKKKQLRWFGVAHNAQKLVGNSFTQRIISARLTGYFVLSDYVLEWLKTANYRGRIAYFYPIFFPQHPVVNIEKPANELWLGIPGQVELKRRDYLLLVDAAKKLDEARQVRFFLLGACAHEAGSGEAVKARLGDSTVANQFVFFEQYISNDLFFSYLEKMDALMPLIHPDETGRFANYAAFQISGTFSISLGLKIPMLLATSFQNYPCFAPFSLFYEPTELGLATTLTKLSADDLAMKRTLLEQATTLQFDHQQQLFNQFIGLEN